MVAKHNLPAEAWKAAGPNDRARAEKAQERGAIQITWPEKDAIKAWARQRGWPAPWFGFKDAFLKQMFERDDSFGLAVRESGIRIAIPVERHVISDRQLREFDALYEERSGSGSGRPTGWGRLVEELREIRRMVEAGIVVEVDGKTLESWQGFYTWAHGRYHMLEDGYDSWIGDDKS